MAEKDIIRFTDIRQDQLRLVGREGDSLVIGYGETDSITINNYFAEGGCNIVEQIAFQDEAALSLQSLIDEWEKPALTQATVNLSPPSPLSSHNSLTEALLVNQVDNLINAMAAFGVPASGQMSFSDSTQERSQTLIAVNPQ